MIIIDQNMVEGNFDFIGEVHNEMIKDIIVETLDEVSPTGLTILQSAGVSTETLSEAIKNKNIVVNDDDIDYDYRIGAIKYKLENISFI